jgi:hypothetical protein
MLRIGGGFLFLVGILSGASLVARPFGLLGASAEAAWLLFPIGFAAGSLMLALALELPELPALWRACSAALIALAVASAVGLGMAILGVAEPVGSTLSLWYVLILGGVVGSGFALFPSRPSVRPQA